MTSRISFFKLTCSEWRKLGWLTAVQALAFGLLIPFRLLIDLATARNGMTSETPENILYTSVGFGKAHITAMITGLGILCALCVFEYLHSQEKLDFYHSLALRREKLFFVKYTAGAMTFVTAYLASQILAVLVGAIYGVRSAAVVQEMTVASLQGILFFLTSYAAAIVAVMLTGKVLTSVLAVATFAGYGLLLWVVAAECMGIFLPTLYLSGTWITRERVLNYSSPWTLIITWQPEGDSIRQGVTGMWPDLRSICLFLILPAALTLVSLALCRARRTEAAGKALAFQWTEGLIKLLLAIPAALLAGVFSYDNFRSPVWEICFIVLFGVLLCLIMEFIYRWDIRQIFSHKWHMAATVAAALIVFLGMRFDVAHVNTYLPAQEELAAMSVRYPYNEFSYFDENGEPISGWKEKLRLLETGQVELLYPLAENGVQRLEKNSGERPAADSRVTQVSIEYRLKSGRIVFRNYLVDYSLYRETMEKLLSDEAYCRKYYPILTWDDAMLENAEHIYTLLPEDLQETLGVSRPESATDVVMYSMSAESGIESTSYMTYCTLSGKESRKLIEAYQKDLAENPGGLIDADSFGTLNIEWRKDLAGQYLADEYPLTEDFTRTKKALLEILAEEASE